LVLPMKNDVLKFINRFTSGSKKAAVEECFTQGCCFWFAYILQRRFHGTIVYAQIDNHFGCLIWNHVYDITGDVTDQYPWENWDILSQTDPLLYNRLIRDCVEFREVEE